MIENSRIKVEDIGSIGVGVAGAVGPLQTGAPILATEFCGILIHGHWGSTLCILRCLERFRFPRRCSSTGRGSGANPSSLRLKPPVLWSKIGGRRILPAGHHWLKCSVKPTPPLKSHQNSSAPVYLGVLSVHSIKLWTTDKAE